MSVPMSGLGSLLQGLATAGPWAAFLGLSMLLLWLIATGRLVPRKTHEQAVASEKQRGDDWKETARLEAARNDVRDKQMDEVLAFVRRPSSSPTREAA